MRFTDNKKKWFRFVISYCYYVHLSGLLNLKIALYYNLRGPMNVCFIQCFYYFEAHVFETAFEVNPDRSRFWAFAF